jgi:hypothetical protein
MQSQKKFLNTLGTASKAIFSASRKWWVRLLTGVVSQGWSETFWIPVSTMDRMWVDVQRGKGADEAYRRALRGAIKETAGLVMMDTLFTQAGKAFAPEIARAKQWTANAYRQTKRLAAEAWDDVSNSMRSRLNRWRTGSTPDVPVIRQRWGDPVTYFDKPISAPGRAPVPTNWIEQLDELSRIDRAMASRVDTLMRQPDAFTMQPVQSWRKGQFVQLSADEMAGHRLLQSMDYQEAVRQGAVPRRIIELTNHTRDKLTRLAVGRAFDRLPSETAGRILRVDFTGTGARPHSPAAISGATDLDLTVMGDYTPRPGETAAAARKAAVAAERNLSWLIEDELAKGVKGVKGVQGDIPGLARVPDASTPSGMRFPSDVNVYRGIHPTDAPSPGAFGSPELTEWVRRDNIFRGSSALRGEKGTVYFGGPPDARPQSGYGPMEQIPKSIPDVGRATADVRRMISQNYGGQMPDLGNPEVALRFMRGDAKDIPRWWWSVNKGSGKVAPKWFNTINQCKADRTFIPAPGDMDEAIRGIQETPIFSGRSGGES